MRVEQLKKFGYLAVIVAVVGIVWSGIMTVNTNIQATDLGGGPESIALLSNDLPSGPCAGNSGLLSPTSEAFDTGGDDDGFELNPSNAFADGSGNASNNNGADDRHRFYDYTFSIPYGCSIQGIEVRLDWWLDSTAASNSMDVELSWDGGTSWTAAKTDSVETTSEHTTTLGAANDDWGRTWALSEIDNTNFRVRLISNSNNKNRDFFLDWVPVTVYY